MASEEAVDSPPDVSASAPTSSPIDEDDKLLSVSAFGAFDGSDERDRLRKVPRWTRKKLENERDRVTYEHMLVRYGSWANVRGQVFAYAFLFFVAHIYMSHCDFVELNNSLHAIENGAHVHCCCEITERICYLERIAKKFKLEDFTEFLKYLFSVLFLMSSPLWERYVGRRTALLLAVLAGTIFSILLIFFNTSELVQVCHVALSVCTSVTIMVSMANLSEMLPYHLRFLSVAIYSIVSGVSNSITDLHFYFGFSFFGLGVLSGTGFTVAIYIVLFIIRDTILHLNIMNEADTVEEMIQSEEMRLMETKPEGNVHFHNRVARKIFEDLVYLDRDELRLGTFLKRIWSHSVIWEIVLALFQAFSAGLHEYESREILAAQFHGAYLLEFERIVGFASSFIVILMLRRFHRVQALTFLFSASLLMATIHHAIVVYDNTNGCALNEQMQPKFHWFSITLSILYICFGSCLQMMILIHFLETTPSILRLSSLMLFYLPMKLGYVLGPKVLSGTQRGEINKLAFLLPFYIYHIVIIIITISRARAKLPFSLYLFELIPVSEKEPESEREDTQFDDEDEPFLPAQKITSSFTPKHLRGMDVSVKGFDPIARVQEMLKKE